MQYILSYGNEPYILICYSDGGTVGHPLAFRDPRCVGLIAHSASFQPRHIQITTPKPVLLLCNTWDLTGMGLVTDYACYWYRTHEADIDADYFKLPRQSWHGHDFHNAFGVMNEWSMRHFDFRLPLK